jgi:hypothetical protein
MRLLFGIFFLPFFLCAQTIDYDISSIPEGYGRASNAVVRLETMDVEIASIRSMTATYKRVVTIMNEAGNEHVMGHVGYDDGIKVKNVSAKIYNSSGDLIEKLKQNDFIDVSAVDGGSLYTDSRMLLLNYFPIEYPYTVEFEYTIASNNTGTLPNWFFHKGFLVDVLNSRYTISFEIPELRPIIKEKNFDGYTIHKHESENSIRYSTQNLKMLRHEALSPSFSHIMPHILVAPTQFYYEGFEGEIRNWEQAGQWMNTNILSGQGVLPMATVNLARRLVAGVEDDLEKAKIIFDYVQENTRYISVQVGIGGIRPISAQEVDQVKYGDCKGLSNYTKSLLSAVGVESYYVHVEAGSDQVDFESDFASLAQGNHVILAVPYEGQYYWLDSTSQTIPFGYIADFTDDRSVLVIKPNGGELHKTKSYQDDTNVQSTKAEYQLDEQGAISGKITIATSGTQYGDHYYLETMEKLDVNKYYKRYWSNINNLELVSFGFENNEEEVEFVERVTVKAEKYASNLDNKMMFVANAFNNQQYVPPRYRSRNFPFQIQRGYFDTDEYRILLPQGYEVESLPEVARLNTEFGTYDLNVSVQDDGRILVKRAILLKKGYYPKEDYKAFRSFMRNIAKHDKSKIIIHKKASP